MQTPSLNITPIVTTQKITKAVLSHMIVYFEQESWATIRLHLQDENGQTLVAQDVPMTLEESQGWTGGDEYVINLALQKLGISTVTAAPKVK